MKVDAASAESVGTRAITVSIVSHGHREDVRTLIAQLAALNEPTLRRVVLIHNLPDDDMPQPREMSFELVQLHNVQPLGFAENHNLAFTRCETSWFAVLNPDIDLVYGNPFPALLDAADRAPRTGCVAPALIDPVSRNPEPHRGIVTPLELIRRRMPNWAPPQTSAWLVGAFLLLRSRAFRAAHGFDQRFRLYCEDVDLSMRLRLAGWAVDRVDDCWVLHNKQQTSHRSLRYGYWHVQSLFRMWTSSAFWHYLRKYGRCRRTDAVAAHGARGR